MKTRSWNLIKSARHWGVRMRLGSVIGFFSTPCGVSRLSAARSMYRLGKSDKKLSTVSAAARPAWAQITSGAGFCSRTLLRSSEVSSSASIWMSIGTSYAAARLNTRRESGAVASIDISGAPRSGIT